MPAPNLILFLLCLANLQVMAQSPAPHANCNKRLLFLVEGETDIRATVAGAVGECLKSLRPAGSNGRKLFCEVTDLYDLSGTLKMEKKVFDVYKYFQPGDAEKKSNGPHRTGRDSAFGSLLENYDRFLHITIKRFDTNSFRVLCNFVVYEMIKGANELPVASSSNRTGGWIDITENSIYSKVMYQLRKLFPESNAAPQAAIGSNAVVFGGKNYLLTGDTLQLFPKIKDTDSESEFISFYWEQTPNHRRLFLEKLPVKSFDSIQQLVLKNTGEYAFMLVASDQISQALSDTFFVFVFNRPKIRGCLSYHYLRVGKKNAKAAHPFDALFQPYIFTDSVKTIPFNFTEIIPVETPSCDSHFTLRPVESKGPKDDSIANCSFEIKYTGEQWRIAHYPDKQKAGIHSFWLTLHDRGYQSEPYLLKLRYRKVAPFYFCTGFTTSRFKNATQSMAIYYTNTVGLFLHPNVHLEYAYEIPLGDSLLGRNRNFYYPNHRTSVLAPFPFLPDGLYIAVQFDFMLMRYPLYSSGLFGVMGGGINIRMMYRSYPWLGSRISFNYIGIRQFDWRPAPKNQISMTLGFILQPVSRNKRGRGI